MDSGSGRLDQVVISFRLLCDRCQRLDDGVALPLHHLGKAQGFAGEGAVAICGSVLGVENADEVEDHKARVQ